MALWTRPPRQNTAPENWPVTSRRASCIVPLRLRCGRFSDARSHTELRVVLDTSVRSTVNPAQGSHPCPSFNVQSRRGRLATSRVTQTVQTGGTRLAAATPSLIDVTIRPAAIHVRQASASFLCLGHCRPFMTHRQSSHPCEVNPHSCHDRVSRETIAFSPSGNHATSAHAHQNPGVLEIHHRDHARWTSYQYTMPDRSNGRECATFSFAIVAAEDGNRIADSSGSRAMRPSLPSASRFSLRGVHGRLLPASSFH